jgi:hypothetical protein
LWARPVEPPGVALRDVVVGKEAAWEALCCLGFIKAQLLGQHGFGSTGHGRRYCLVAPARPRQIIVAPTLGRFIDIISSKQWANGPKDREALRELLAVPEPGTPNDPTSPSRRPRAGSVPS